LKRKINRYRLNHQIQASQVRVIDSQGKQVGVISLGEALARAQKDELDLIEIAPQAKPPVCKLVDYKKFTYEQDKKRTKERKKAKKAELKEVRFTPFIAENDFNVRLRRAEKFLKNGSKLKLSVKFKGRELGKKQFGYQVLGKAVEALKPLAQVETESKFVGRRLELLLKPIKNEGQKNETKDQEISLQKTEGN